jgi:hypothetical protein
MPDPVTLYDEEFYLWTLKMAEALRRGRFTELDPEHLAEEIADMGKNNAENWKAGLRRSSSTCSTSNWQRV